MTLQVVHTEGRPIRASSLYCCWIRVPESAELRAIWIDSEMRAFEKQFAGEASEGALVDEPGGPGWRRAGERGEAAVTELYK